VSLSIDYIFQQLAGGLPAVGMVLREIDIDQSNLEVV
jgi:hypothetical protein